MEEEPWHASPFTDLGSVHPVAFSDGVRWQCANSWAAKLWCKRDNLVTGDLPLK